METSNIKLDMDSMRGILRRLSVSVLEISNEEYKFLYEFIRYNCQAGTLLDDIPNDNVDKWTITLLTPLVSELVQKLIEKGTDTEMWKNILHDDYLSDGHYEGIGEQAFIERELPKHIVSDMFIRELRNKLIHSTKHHTLLNIVPQEIAEVIKYQ